MFRGLSCSCLCPIHWSQVLSWERRCSWSSADRRCSNYIWVINNFIAFWGVPYITGFTVFWVILCVVQCCLSLLSVIRSNKRANEPLNIKTSHIGWWNSNTGKKKKVINIFNEISVVALMIQGSRASAGITLTQIMACCLIIIKSLPELLQTYQWNRNISNKILAIYGRFHSYSKNTMKNNFKMSYIFSWPEWKKNEGKLFGFEYCIQACKYRILLIRICKWILICLSTFNDYILFLFPIAGNQGWYMLQTPILSYIFISIHWGLLGWNIFMYYDLNFAEICFSSVTKMFILLFKSYWNLFPCVQLKICHHWCR